MFRLAILGLALGSGSAMAEQVPVWTTGAGTTTLLFQRGLLSAAGFGARGESNAEFSADFRLTDESAIKFVSPWGSPDSFLGGSLKCGRGFSLSMRRGAETNDVAILPLELFALKDTDVFEIRDEDGEPVLTVDHFDVHFDPGLHSLLLQRGNVRFANRFAQGIGRPGLSGLLVGIADCVIEVHELAARIDRKPRPVPAICDLPAGTNASLRIHAVDEIQQVDEIAGGICPVAVGVTLENPGPDALERSSLEAAKLGLALFVAKNGVTSELVRAEQAIRIDPAERCPCPDEARFYPGYFARRSLADVIREKAWLGIPVETLEEASRGDAILFFEARLGESSSRRQMKPVKCDGMWTFAPVP